MKLLTRPLNACYKNTVLLYLKIIKVNIKIYYKVLLLTLVIIIIIILLLMQVYNTIDKNYIKFLALVIGLCKQKMYVI
jgi:hypothetical protein